MKILNSTINDIDEILTLYQLATELQKEKAVVAWPLFERSLIENAINENRQWKMIIDNKISCVWTTAFNDPIIWEGRNNEPSVYIHRIANHPNFRGRKLVSGIVDWAIKYANLYNKRFIRMDTVGNNEKLISYYQSCGFIFLGFSRLNNTAGLPAHYKNATVSLFEIDLKNSNFSIYDIFKSLYVKY